VPIDSIRLNPKNPNRHTRRDILKLGGSIKALGIVPVILNAQNMLLAGEARVRACRELGWKTIPAIRFEHLSPAEADLFLIAENRFSELSSFDEQALGRLLQDLSVLNLDLSLELSGFETGEIDVLIEGLELAPVEDDTSLEAASRGPAVARLGDLWILRDPKSGLEHRLFVGDALEAASYETLMGGVEAAAVLTDPPFGGTIASYVKGGKARRREFVMGSEGRTPAELEAMLEPMCRRLREAARPGGLVYVFMDWRGLEVLLRVGGRVFGELKNVVTWVKTNPGMGSLYRSQSEFIALFKVEGGAHANNIQLGRFGRNRSNVWTYAGMSSPEARSTDEGDLLSLHPTVKPVAMIADAILDCTSRGEIVLDPFLGSGTTLIAAERTGRRAFGMELDPLYADVAIRRWRLLTGEDAVRAAGGRSFSALETEAAP
jgi:DNA modification methylase